jgi:hypothetical protein
MMESHPDKGLKPLAWTFNCITPYDYYRNLVCI